MPEKTVIYHNPRCSKSRQTLGLLKDHGIDPEIVEYLQSPPSKKELQRVLKMLDLSPRDLLRKKEKAYKEECLDDPALSNEKILEKMINNPILIERPIVIKGSRAAIGRPPEKILDLL